MAIGIGNLLTMIVGGYIFLQRPSAAAKKVAMDVADELENQKTACQYKHLRIDEIFGDIKKSMGDIKYSFQHFKENEFHHIEDNSKEINISMATLNGKMDLVVKIMTEVLNKK